MHDTGWIGGFRSRHRFSRVGETRLRRGSVKEIAYCPDGLTRTVLGFQDKRLAKPWWDILFLNPTWTGVPVLSEPTGTYQLDDLKKKVLRKYVSAYPHPDDKREIRSGIEAAQTFDDLLDVVMRW